ncbi:MAG: ATP-grasp domain-containing protein [Polyangiaceae bacterium]
MAETRILILSNRDPEASLDGSPPSAAARLTEGGDSPRKDCLADDDNIADNSVALVADMIMDAIASAPGVRVAHRAVLRPGEILNAIGEHRPNVVFNLCESLAGDSRFEATAAWLFERLGLPFTGSPYLALRHCLYKVECSQMLARAGVRLPATVRVDSPDNLPKIRFPAIVKPEREDGSAGIGRKSVVYNYKRLREQVAEVIETCEQPAVVQQYIKGRELAVSLLGWPVPRVLPPGEILFNDLPKGHPHILTYSAKWRSDSVDFVGTPSVAAVLRPHELRKVAAIGRRTFEVLGLRDYGRVDVRLDDRGDPYVIDVNPNCDLSPDGGFARACKRAGMDYQRAVWEILRGAIRRSSEGKVLHFASRGRAPRLDRHRGVPLDRHTGATPLYPAGASVDVNAAHAAQLARAAGDGLMGAGVS